jgi:hypothetical protein
MMRVARVGKEMDEVSEVTFGFYYCCQFGFYLLEPYVVVVAHMFTFPRFFEETIAETVNIIMYLGISLYSQLIIMFLCHNHNSGLCRDW